PSRLTHNTAAWPAGAFRSRNQPRPARGTGPGPGPRRGSRSSGLASRRLRRRPRGCTLAVPGLDVDRVRGLPRRGPVRPRARRAGSPARALALIGLNPLVLVHVVGGPHNDALMMLGVVAAVVALGDGRAAGSGATLAAAVAVKTAAAFVAPFALIGAKSDRRR